MINVEVSENEGLIIVEPEGVLEQFDFEKLAAQIDAFSEDKGQLKGMLIYARTFPGWDDFSAFMQHMKFIRDNHTKVKRIAIVTDSKLGEVGPAIAKHFIAAEVRHFSYENFIDAKQWAQQSV